MRIELVLENLRPESGVIIPLAYNHALASCIYQTLAASSADYSEELHDRGVPFQGKQFKLFTFSQLLADRRRVMGDRLHLLSPIIRWLVSSPLDEFIIHFANGILERGVVRLHETQFRVREVRTLTPPTFTRQMRFTCLSPITVSTHTDIPGLNPLQYCRLQDGFYDKVTENLRRKYTILNGNSVDGFSLNMAFDANYMARRRIDKLIDFKGTEIFAYLCPFTVEGSPELIRIGYECGFGDGNSKGFGMVEVDNASQRNQR